MVKERGIIMQPPMARAIDELLKTETRRISGLHDINEDPDAWRLAGVNCHESFVARFESSDGEKHVKCPYGKPGDRLWVRETFYDNCPGYGPEEAELYFKADGLPDFEGEESELRWTPSIHMPRWASRFTLEIANIWLERIQSITSEEAVREGMDVFWVEPKGHEAGRYDVKGRWAPTPVDAYETLIKSIHGPEVWDRNLWVWAITFREIERHGGRGGR